MVTGSDLDVDGEATPEAVPDEGSMPCSEPLSADIFVSPRRPSRRILFPLAAPRGRHSAKNKPSGRGRNSGQPETTPKVHLIDGEGHAEITRIALRRSFEDAHRHRREALLFALLLIDHPIVGGQARLGLGLAGPRRGAHPFQFAGDGPLAGFALALLRANALFLLLQPAGVIALVGNAAAAIELECPLVTWSRK